MLAKRVCHPLVILLSVLLWAVPVKAQQAAPAEKEGPVRESAAPARENKVTVLRVRPEDTDQIAEVLRSFDIMVRTSRGLGLITISGSPESVARAEEAVREIERLTMRTPSTAQDVDLTVHFLGIANEDTAPPPGPLRDVVAELKKTLPFPGYRLLETLVLRTSVGDGSEVSGLLPEPQEEGTPPKKYTFQCRVLGIQPKQDTQLVRFGSVRASIRMPIRQGTNLTYEDVGINTGLEVPDGKTVVVGKAGSVGGSQGYLLVLTAKVVK